MSRSAGVTRRTLYYHFDGNEGKDALLAAVFEARHELMLTRIDAWIRKASGDPAAMVGILFEEFAAWAGKPGWQGSGFTRSVMELADMPGHPVRAVARRHKAAIETRLEEQFKGSGVDNPKRIARQIMLLIEGCHSLILIHGDIDYTKAAAAAARLLIEQSRHAPAGQDDSQNRSECVPVRTRYKSSPSTL